MTKVSCVACLVLWLVVDQAPRELHALIDVTLPDVQVFSDPAAASAGSLAVGLAGDGTHQMLAYTTSLGLTARQGAIGSVELTGAADVVGQLIESTGFTFANEGTYVVVTDINDAGTVPVVDGDLFILSFLVGPGTEGVFDVRFVFDPPTPGSEFLDPTAEALPVGFKDGSITVFIPEPSTIAILILWGLMTHLNRRSLP